MPYLNSKGEWCGGVGSLGVHWGNATGAGTTVWGSGAGGAQWLDDDNIIGQDCSSGTCKLRKFNVRTGVSSDVAGGEDGANDIRAGGGVWAKWLAGAGVRTSDPPNFSDAGAGVGPVGRTGDIAIKRLRQSNGGWDIHQKDGQVWTLTEGDAGDINPLGGHRAAWVEAGEPQAIGVPVPSPGSRPFWWLKMLETPKGWYVLYAMPTGQTVLHSVYSTQGYVVTTGDAFSPDMIVLSGNKIRIVWSPTAGETDVVVRDIDLDVELATAPVGGTPPPPYTGDTGSDSGFGIGTVTLTSVGTFPVAGAAEELITLPQDVFPAYPAEGGHGRIVHPTLGAFDYEVKPDEWVNIDADAIIAPVWSSTRTLTSAANVLWKGNLRDVVIEERWKAIGGLAMPITQLRMLLAIWTTPVDPDVGYVQWFPNYITNVAFNVLPMLLTAGGQGVTFDDVVNYKDEDGNPIGWMTNPVTFTLKIVGRL